MILSTQGLLRTFYVYPSSTRITVEFNFGEINLWWSVYWKILKFGLDYATLIVEAATRLHNYLVTYREDQFTSTDSYTDRRVFEDGYNNDRVSSIVLDNDPNHDRGNIS